MFEVVDKVSCKLERIAVKYGVRQMLLVIFFFLTSLKCGIVKRNRRVTKKSERDNRKELVGEILWPYSKVSPCGCKVCPWPLLEL